MLKHDSAYVGLGVPVLWKKELALAPEGPRKPIKPKMGINTHINLILKFETSI